MEPTIFWIYHCIHSFEQTLTNEWFVFGGIVSAILRRKWKDPWRIFPTFRFWRVFRQLHCKYTSCFVLYTEAKSIPFQSYTLETIMIHTSSEFFSHIPTIFLANFGTRIASNTNWDKEAWGILNFLNVPNCKIMCIIWGNVSRENLPIRSGRSVWLW